MRNLSTWNLLVKFHAFLQRVKWYFLLFQNVILYFCNNIVFFEGKKLIKAVSSDIAETDNMPQIMNEAKRLKTLSSICGSTPNIYLIVTHWWAPGETQELMTTRMYSNLFRGGGWSESSLSNFYTGPMFIKKWRLFRYY